MSEKHDTSDDSGPPLGSMPDGTRSPTVDPDGPEQLQLWRRLIEIRDGLIETIAFFESAARPGQEHLTHLDQRYDTNGRLVREDNEAARRYARRLRDKLLRLDAAIRTNTREQANDRGFSLRQLRELTSDNEHRVARARKTLEAWWADREHTEKRHLARLWIWRARNCTDATPTDFSRLPDLDALRDEDIRFRRDRGHEPSGAVRKACGRIVDRFLERRDD